MSWKDWSYDLRMGVILGGIFLTLVQTKNYFSDKVQLSLPLLIIGIIMIIVGIFCTYKYKNRGKR